MTEITLVRYAQRCRITDCRATWNPCPSALCASYHVGQACPGLSVVDVCPEHVGEACLTSGCGALAAFWFCAFDDGPHQHCAAHIAAEHADQCAFAASIGETDAVDETWSAIEWADGPVRGGIASF